MQRITLVTLVLLLCGVGFGAYDNSNVDVTCGGYGNATADGNGAIFGTTIQPAYTFNTTGTLTKVRLKVNGSTPSGTFKIKIFSGTAADADLEREQDVTSQLAAQMQTSWFDVVFTVSLAVNPGEFLGVYTDANLSFGRFNITAGPPWYNQGSDITGDGTNFGSVQGTTHGLAVDCTVESNEYINLDDSAGHGNGDTIYPAYYEDQPQYFIFEDVDVPDAESLAISLYYTNTTTGADSLLKTLTVNFTADTIAMDAESDSLTGQDGETFNIHMWLDPINDLIEVLYVNTEAGQGISGAVKDIRHISLHKRIPVAITADVFVRRITFTNAGTNATVGQVWATRKPCLVIGDSVAEQVSTKLAAAFTEERVVIQGAIGGNYTSRDDTNATVNNRSTGLRDRWNSGGGAVDASIDGSLDARITQDLVEYRDVIVCPISGPGANDLAQAIGASTIDSQQRSLAMRVGGDIGRMIGDAVAGSVRNASATTFDNAINDVIACEMIPRNDSAGAESDNREQTIKYLNDILASQSNQLQVPLALTYDNYDANGGYDDTVHPDTAGETWIAQQIASAYENNTIAPATGGPSSIFTGTSRSIFK